MTEYDFVVISPPTVSSTASSSPTVSSNAWLFVSMTWFRAERSYELHILAPSGRGDVRAQVLRELDGDRQAARPLVRRRYMGRYG